MEGSSKPIKLEEFVSSNVKQEDGSFDFENEAMALKGNLDYMALVSCINMLTALRTAALKDIDKVLQIQDEALMNPMEFIRKLEHGEDIGVPQRLVVPEVPEVDWSKYNTQPTQLRFTRPKQRETKPEVPKPVPSTSDEDVVRGRTKTKTKPATFNKLWTPEEQLRLEELLIKFPPEQNEARRFAKIAEALGNRTLSQVTSRCQKYFEKLHKIGLPVPGRSPRVRNKKTKPSVRASYVSTSTFFPRAFPPVPFTEVNLPGTSSVNVSFIKVENEDSNDLSDGESRRAVLERRVRADLARHSNDPLLNHGFTCNACKEEPIVGTRWHCMECQDVDFCGPCLLSQVVGEGGESDPPHPLSHPLASHRPVRTTNADKDYHQADGQYNYLDTNFRPE